MRFCSTHAVISSLVEACSERMENNKDIKEDGPATQPVSCNKKHVCLSILYSCEHMH